MTEMEDFGIFVLLIFWFDIREKELFISCDCVLVLVVGCSEYLSLLMECEQFVTHKCLNYSIVTLFCMKIVN